MSKIHTRQTGIWAFALLAALLFLGGAKAHADIEGIEGPVFNLTARPDYISTSDGDRYLFWGFAYTGPGIASRTQYPGPTLKVTVGQEVTVNLTNRLTVPVSIVFPGQKVTATGGSAGDITQEATRTQPVTYRFTPDQPGTYLYRSGTRPDLQVEMGLVGALIVYPATAGQAYDHPDSAFDREFLYLITEMDPQIHRYVEFGQMNLVNTTNYFATNWFINGRNFPDLMADAKVSWLPTQPYNCQPRMHPGEKVLLRIIGAGQDLHPMHFHGNDFETIAVDGRLLSSGPGNGADLAWKATTIKTIPGQTADAMWTWTGEQLGWDIYGHLPGDGTSCTDGNGDGLDDVTREYCNDHQIPFPVTLPTRDSMTFGQFYPGTPFLGGTGDLAPGDPGLNSTGAFFYMWHSHTEKELTSNDIWPGGLVSFMIIEHPEVPLP